MRWMNEENYVAKRQRGQTLVINDIICNGLMEQDGEEEAQMHNDKPIF